MHDPPDLAALLGDAQEVSRCTRRLARRSRDVADAGRRERPSLWSGKPRHAAALRELAAEARRCAVLAASVGLREPDSAGSTWIESAADLRRTADAWERLARLTAGWGWRKPIIAGALWGLLAGLLAAGIMTSLLGRLLGAW